LRRHCRTCSCTMPIFIAGGAREGQQKEKHTHPPTDPHTHTHTHTHTYPPLVKFRGICGKSSLHHVQLPVWQQDEATPPYRLSTAAGRKGCAWIVTTLNAFNHAATVRNAAKGAAQSGMPTGGRSPLRNVAVPPLQQLSHTAGTSRTSHHDASPPVCGDLGRSRAENAFPCCCFSRAGEAQPARSAIDNRRREIPGWSIRFICPNVIRTIRSSALR